MSTCLKMTPFHILVLVSTFLGCGCLDLNNPFFDRYKRRLCKLKPFGITGIKVEVCETVFQIRRDRKPIRTSNIGKVGPEAAEKLQEVFGELLKPMTFNAVGRGGFSEHDGDMCCPTVRALHQAPPIMKNAHGQYRGVVHLVDSGLYQYYSVGKCVTDPAQKNCKGTCLEEKATVYLMVVRDDMAMDFSFEPFEVPSYCSCKNIGASDTRARVKPDVSSNKTEPTTTTPPQTTRSSPMSNSRRATIPALPPTKPRFDFVKYSRISSARLMEILRASGVTLPGRVYNVSQSVSANETSPTMQVDITPSPVTNTSEPAT